MQPERAARLLAQLGAALLLTVLLARLFFLLTAIRERQETLQVPQADYIPHLSTYELSPDGRLLEFSTFVLPGNPARPGERFDPTYNYFLYDLTGGTLINGRLPVPRDYFSIEDGTVAAVFDESAPRYSLIPQGLVISRLVYSADRQRIALVSQPQPGREQLYALSWFNKAVLVAEEASLGDIAWSARKAGALAERGELTGSQLAYTAPRNGIDQLFRYRFDEASPQQLTFDPTNKASPAWSTDGRSLAYIAYDPPASPAVTPTAQNLPAPSQEPAVERALYILHLNEGDSALPKPTRLEAVDRLAFQPHWLGDQVAYSTWVDPGGHIAHFFSIDPDGGLPRRLFPPLAIDRIDCSAAPGFRPAALVKISLSNTSPAPLSVLLQAQVQPAGRQVFGLLDQETTGARAETVSLQPGEIRQIEWKLIIPNQALTNLTVLIDPGWGFPYSEKTCRVTRPGTAVIQLPWLGVSLLITLFAGLLAVPWLRNMQQRRWWLAWFLAYGLLLSMLAAESLLRLV